MREMKEIKFKGWFESTKIMSIPFSMEDLMNGEADLLEGEKLLQYTGLKDKNGVEIYEGDIVTHNGYEFSVVVFRKGAFQINNIIDGLTTDNHYSLGNVHLDMYKVVGNIYENEELLK